MYASTTLELLLLILRKARLLVHVDPMHGRASEEEGEIERVAVVGRDDSRFGFSDVLKEATESSRLREGQGSGRTRDRKSVV